MPKPKQSIVIATNSELLSTSCIIVVPDDAQLHDPEFREELKAYVRKQEISQRDWPTAIQDMFLRAYILGVLFQHEGEPFEIPLVDDVWGDERYIREFLRSEACEHPEKDRLIAIYRDYRERRFGN